MTVAEQLSPVLGSRHIPPHAPRELTTLLADLGLRSVADEPALMSAAEVLRLWGVRLQTAATTGKLLRGAAQLVDGLRHIPADTEVEQFGLTGGHMAGVVLFDGRDDQFIGAVVVER